MMIAPRSISRTPHTHQLLASDQTKMAEFMEYGSIEFIFACLAAFWVMLTLFNSLGFV